MFLVTDKNIFCSDFKSEKNNNFWTGVDLKVIWMILIKKGNISTECNVTIQIIIYLVHSISNTSSPVAQQSFFKGIIPFML